MARQKDRFVIKVFGSNKDQEQVNNLSSNSTFCLLPSNTSPSSISKPDCILLFLDQLNSQTDILIYLKEHPNTLCLIFSTNTNPNFSTEITNPKKVFNPNLLNAFFLNEYLPTYLQSIQIHTSELLDTSIYNTSSEAIVVATPEMNFVEANPSALKMFGYSREDFLKLKVPDLHPPIIRESIQKVFKRFVQTGTFKAELEFVHQNGEFFYGEIYAQTFKHNGKTYCQGCIRNINKRHENEEQLRLLKIAADTVTDGIIITDPSQKDNPIVYASQGFCRLTGFQQNEVIGRNCRFLQGPDTDPHTKESIKNAVQSGKMFQGEILNYKKNGQPFWNLIKLGPIRDHRGELTHFVGSQTDITEKKIAEMALKNNELRMRTIMEHVNDGIWEWGIDLEGQGNTNLYISSSFKRMLGYIRNEPDDISQTWEKIIHPEDLKIIEENLKKHLNTNGRYPFYQEVRFKHLKGHWIWVLTRGVALKDHKTGKFTRMVGTHTDITLLKKRELEIREQHELLEKKSVEMEKFVYTISHDLKNPLVTIRGFSGLISEDLEAENYQDVLSHFKRIERATLRMLTMINELLELSRIGRVVDPDENIQLKDIAEEVLHHWRDSLDSAQAQITFDSDWPHEWCDKNRLREVYENLISNAIKYKKNDIPLKLSLGYDFDQNYYYVLDNGIGIAPEYRTKVFDIFERLNQEVEGTGVGLAIVKRIIEYHGGTIWIAPSEQGSCFCFTLRNHERRD